MISALHRARILGTAVTLSSVLLVSTSTLAREPSGEDLLVPALEPSARSVLAAPRNDEVRQQAVRINTTSLEHAAEAGGTRVVRVPLFDGRAVQLLLTAEPSSDPDATTWTGYLLDDPNSSVVATYRGRQLVADIWTSNGSYRVRPAASGLHRLAEVDLDRVQPELAPVAVDLPAGPRGRRPGLGSGGSGGSGSGPDLDLLFAYTPDARKASGGPSEIQSQVLNMVAWMNLSLANAGQTGRARVAGIVPTDYTTRSDDLLDSLQDLRDGEGTLRALHDERERVGADVVVLLQEKGNGCGLSYLMQSPSSSFSSYAFSVVLRECTTSLAHEVGHLLGAQHEADATSVAGLYSYSHGLVDLKAGWRTTMATGRACLEQHASCPRIPFFSDPSVSFRGDLVGDAAASDNARTIASTWAVASAFRRGASRLAPPARLRLRSRKGRVVLKWKKSGDVDGYEILRSTEDGELEAVGHAAGQAKRFVDGKVSLRTARYCYQLAATSGEAQAIAGPVCTAQ